MSTIKKSILPPLGGTRATITEADRPNILAQAAAVLNYYLNGAGSYYDAGPRKPLQATLADLQGFRENVLVIQQYTTDQAGIIQSVLDSIQKAKDRVQTAIENNLIRDHIEAPLRDTPGSRDVIIDPGPLGRSSPADKIPITLQSSEGNLDVYNPGSNLAARLAYDPDVVAAHSDDNRYAPDGVPFYTGNSEPTAAQDATPGTRKFFGSRPIGDGNVVGNWSGATLTNDKSYQPPHDLRSDQERGFDNVNAARKPLVGLVSGTPMQHWMMPIFDTRFYE